MMEKDHALDSDEFAASFGFECVGRTDAQNLKPIPEVRDMCAADLCRSFGKNWMCPPANGDIDFFAAQMAQKDSVVIVQSVAELEDDFDFETIMETAQTHDKRFVEYAQAIKEA